MGIPGRVARFIRLHLRVVWWVAEYIRAERAWFYAPLLLLLLFMGLFIFVTANPTISPFLYALF